jgi:transcriptional regulator of acetoin/glycerol metabolism
LGEAKILELYDIYGTERVSFATIKYLMDKEKIKKELGNLHCIMDAAKKCGVHRSTIYRQIKKSRSF